MRDRLIAWLQLLRLPNVFTAVADVAMGYLVTRGDLQPPATFALLVAASCLLYLSGMVLNDVFDAEVDARDRPGRPIPSGRIAKRTASACGFALFISGIVVAWYLTYTTHDFRPGIVATLLGGCIILYDRVLKRTLFAPLLMGACRALNVLMGMSLAAFDGLGASAASPSVEWGTSAAWLIALGIGVYITGVTVFARTEARESCRSRLATGLVILLGGMALLAAIPWVTANEPSLHVSKLGWLLLWAALAFITGRRCVMAVARPAPKTVQAAVRHCVQSIIVLDAAVCVGYVGPFWGFVVLTLLLPTFLLTVWLDAT